MPAPRVRADHDSVKRFARTFAQEDEITQKMLGNLKNELTVLQNGDWIGKGAAAFYGEMNGQILPAMSRLVSALNQAAEVTKEIGAIIQQTEEGAARLFIASADSTGEVTAPPGSSLRSGMMPADALPLSAVSPVKQKQPAGKASGGQSPVADPEDPAQVEPLGIPLETPDFLENVPPPPPPPPKNRSLQYVDRDPKSIFAETYLSTFGKTKLKGANSDKLNSAMEKLLENPSAAERDRWLKIVARERGKTLKEIRSDYNRFLE